MNRRDVLVAGTLAAGLVALLLPIASIGVDPHHDGIMVKPALDVLSGQVPFRDTFIQYGMLSSYLQAAALWIQPTLLTIRWLAVASYAISLILFYSAWRLVLPRSLAVVAAVFFILFIPVYERNYWNGDYWPLLPWSSNFAMLFQALGLYALFRVIRGEQPERWALVLGVNCALVFWCRQPVGITMAGTLLIVWPVLHWTGWIPAGSTGRRVAGLLVGGFVIVNLVLFGGLALNGALAEFWYQNIVWPARWSQDVHWINTLSRSVHPLAAGEMFLLALALAAPVLLPRIRPGWFVRLALICWPLLGALLIWQHEHFRQVFSTDANGWLALIPLVIIVQAGLCIGRAVCDRGASQPVEYYLVAAWAALSLASLPQYYPMADPWHILHALAPGFGLFVFACWRWSGRSVPVVSAVLGLALLPMVFFRLEAMGPAVNRPLVTLTKPVLLRGMKVPAEQAHSFEQIADTINLVMRHRPDLPCAMIGNDALYLCFTTNLAIPCLTMSLGRALPGRRTRRGGGLASHGQGRC